MVHSFKEFVAEKEALDLALLDVVSESEFAEFIGEEVVETELNEKAASTSNGIQPWQNAKMSLPKNANADDQELIKQIEDMFNKEILPFIQKAGADFKRGMQRAGSTKQAKVLFDIKTPKSILSKMVRGKNITEMHDILRGAILAKDEEDVKQIDKNLKKVFKIYEREVKEFKGDKNYGYHGSYHYLVEVGDGVLAEIQLMTKGLWNLKHEAHHIYTMTREKLKKDPNFATSAEFKKLQTQSKQLFLRANGNKGVQIK